MFDDVPDGDNLRVRVPEGPESGRRVRRFPAQQTRQGDVVVLRGRQRVFRFETH